MEINEGIKYMGTGIIVCGCNGSGKSTLGKELAKKLNYTFMDIEDYYFPQRTANYIYDYARSRDEVESLLLNDLRQCDHFVLAAVKGNYSEELTSLYKCAVFISVPKEIRIQRVRNRSFQKFGNRMLQGGDLYEREKQFFDIVELRTEQDIEGWLKSINCPVICVDGRVSVSENIELIIRELQQFTEI